LCTYIQVFYRSPGFFFRGKFIPKITIIGNIGGCKTIGLDNASDFSYFCYEAVSQYNSNDD